MKINIITHYYPPEPGAPQARISEMAKSWQEAGAQVSVFTGMPNHPDGVIQPPYKKRCFAEEETDGIKVFRHWLYATPNKGFLKKIINHLSFMFSVVLLSLFRGPKPDVIVVSSPTLFAVISAYIISVIRRAPFVFEVRDLWPGIFIELGVLKNKMIIGILESLEIFLYRRAALVVTVTEGFKDNIAARGISKDKIAVITNGADLLKFFPGDKNDKLKEQLKLDKNSFLVLYAGAHGISQGLIAILKAALTLNDEERIHFVFVGDGADKEKMVSFAVENELKNVSFLPPVPKEEMAALYRSADLCLVPLRNIPGFKTFIPSKMFEILACKTPVLASLEGEAAKILEKSNSAVVVPPEDIELIAKNIVELSNDNARLLKMAENSYDFVDKYYNRRKLADKYFSLLEQLVNKEVKK